MQANCQMNSGQLKIKKKSTQKIYLGTQGHSRWALQKIKKTLHHCKVLIIRVENIGIEPMTF